MSADPMHAAASGPWEVDERGFSSDLAAPDLMAWMLRFAILAPSTHNTQPWLFRLRDDGVELWADPSRVLRRIDPERRQLYMSCGAALFNLRVALRRMGIADDVTYLPDRGRPELLAWVRPGRHLRASDRDRALFAAIPRRRTNREPYRPIPVSSAISDRLVLEAATEGAWLVRLDPPDKAEVADVVACADRQQLGDPTFRREMARWLVPRGSRRLDGIPMVKKDVPTTLPLASTLLIRNFDRGGGVAAREQELATHSPMLAVLGTARDEPRDWLTAGEAMQAVLLRATDLGLGASFLNQAVEEPMLRPRIAAASGQHGAPQLVLRFGYGPEILPTPRRPLDEVLQRSLGTMAGG